MSFGLDLNLKVTEHLHTASAAGGVSNRPIFEPTGNTADLESFVEYVAFMRVFVDFSGLREFRAARPVVVLSLIDPRTWARHNLTQLIAIKHCYYDTCHLLHSCTRHHLRIIVEPSWPEPAALSPDS
jgi:hypothetical protein